MVKFNWISDKILLQRIFLLGLGGIIARVILNGYVDYNNQVIEYMQSVSYRQVQESSNKYRELMKNKQHVSYLEKTDNELFEEYQDSSNGLKNIMNK